MNDATGTSAASRRSMRDRLRIDFYLTRLEWHLEGALSGKQRKAVIRSLRDELTVESRDLSTALSDLGPPNALAARYAEGETRRPLWSIGVIGAGIALIAYWAVFFSYVAGMLAVVDGNAPAEAHANFLSIQVTAFSNQDGFGIGWISHSAWLITPAIIVALAYILGSRLWRLIGTPADHGAR